MSDKITIIDFTAAWCGPCQQIAPQYDALCKEVAGQAQLVKIDVDKTELKEACAECNIEAMPTFKFFKKGREIHTVKGADLNSVKTKLYQLIELEVLNNPNSTPKDLGNFFAKQGN